MLPQIHERHDSKHWRRLSNMVIEWCLNTKVRNFWDFSNQGRCKVKVKNGNHGQLQPLPDRRIPPQVASFYSLKEDRAATKVRGCRFKGHSFSTKHFLQQKRSDHARCSFGNLNVFLLQDHQWWVLKLQPQTSIHRRCGWNKRQGAFPRRTEHWNYEAEA